MASIVPSATPNPNALKFTIGGVSFDAPKSFAAGADVDDPLASSLLEIDGVISVFMSADFVTLTKTPDAGWDEIVPRATAALEDHF